MNTMMSAEERVVASDSQRLEWSELIGGLAGHLSESELAKAIDQRCGALLRVAGIELQTLAADSERGDAGSLLDVNYESRGHECRLLLTPTLGELSTTAREAILDSIHVTLSDLLNSLDSRRQAEAVAATSDSGNTVRAALTPTSVPDDLLAAFVHKLRNNLGASVTAASQLTEMLADKAGADAAMLLGIVESATEAQRRLIDRFVLLSRPLVVRLARVEVTPILRSILQRYAAINGNQIEIEGLEREVSIETDRTLYAFILNELVENGLEASARHRLVIKVANRDHYFEMSFRNDCGDLPTYVSDSMFKPFFTTKTSRAGLGLSIAQHYARLLGGTIRHRCMRGEAEFTIAIPLGNELNK